MGKKSISRSPANPGNLVLPDSSGSTSDSIHQPLSPKRSVGDIPSSPKSSLPHQVDILPAFRCPISNALMHEPVILQDTCTYEKAVILAWISRGHHQSPMTGLLLPQPLLMVPNIALQNAITEYLSHSPDTTYTLDNDQYDGSVAADDETAINLALDQVEERLRGKGKLLPPPPQPNQAADSTPLDDDEVDASSSPSTSQSILEGGEGGEVELPLSPPTALANDDDLEQQQQQHDDALHSWMSSYCSLPPPILQAYLDLFIDDGATTMDYLVDAEYSKEDLLALGFKQPHLAAILRAIQAYQDMPGETTSQSFIRPSAAGGPLLSSPTILVPGSPTTPIMDQRFTFITSPRSGLSTTTVGDPPSSSSFLPSSPRLGEPTLTLSPTVETMTLIHCLDHLIDEQEDGIGGVVVVVQKDAQKLLMDAAAGMAAYISIPPKPIKDVYEALVLVLRTCKVDVDIVFVALRAIDRLLGAGRQHQQHQMQAAMRERRRRLGEAGLCTILSEIFKRHASRLHILKQWLDLIIRLTAAAQQEEEGDRKTEGLIINSLVSKGVCEQLAAVMKIFAHDREALLSTYVAIIALCIDHQEGKTRIGGAGGIDALCRGMEVFAKDEVMQATACQVIHTLASKHPDNRRQLGLTQACTLVAKAMEVFPTHRQVMYHAMYAVHTLAVHEENTSRLGGNDICRLVCQVLEHFLEDREICYRGCVALVNLTHNNVSNATKLGAANACPLLSKIMQTYLPTDRDVTYHSCCVIINLAYQSEENRQKLGVAGLCYLLAKAMEAYGGDQKVQDKACRAVIYLGFTRENAQNLLSGVGCSGNIASLIARAMDHFCHSREVQYHACGALLVLLQQADEAHVQLFMKSQSRVLVTLIERAKTTFAEEEDDGFQRQAEEVCRRLLS